MRSRGDESGFTLLELLVVLVILPLIIGGVAAAVIAEVNNTSQRDPNGAYQRLADSHDTQITSAYFVRDVDSAAIVSTASSPVLCHPPSVSGGYQLLGLEWPSSAAQASGATRYDVSYFVQQSPLEFVRYYCAGGGYVSTSVVSHDLFSSVTGVTVTQGASCNGTSSCVVKGSTVYVSATVTCTDGSVTCANAGSYPVVPATAGGIGIVNVRVNVLDNSVNGYNYALTGVPRLANSVISGQPPSANPVAPFIINGTVTAKGQCNLIANGLAAINQATGTALSVGSNASLQATYLNTSGGTVSGGGSYPQPVLHDGAIPSPYRKLVEPPTAPSGNPYQVITINTRDWDPSSLPQPLAPAIYKVTNGISVTGNNALNASNGVLFYVTGGNVTLSGKGNMLLNALNPDWEQTTDGTAAPTPEVVLWISKDDTGAQLTLGGNGGAVTINGAIYAPSATTTLNGGGNSGGISTQSLTTGPLTCNGGGSVPINVTVGSPLSSGTIGQPARSLITLSQSNQANITVLGSGHLAPTGTVDVWVCGPETAPPTGCTSDTAGATKVASALPLNPNSTNGTSTATSPSITPPPATTGWYCFATYYSGGVSYQSSNDESTDGCFYDAPPPTISITSPAASACYATLPIPPTSCTTWPGSITGQTTDSGGPGVQQVTITLQDPRGKYWNGTSFTSTTPVQFAATTSDGWADWSVAFNSLSFPLLDTGNYKLSATAKDNNGISSTPATESFTWNG